MKHHLALFWQICLFRRGPQDLPYSMVLLGVCLCLFAGINISMLMIERSFPYALQASLLVVFLWGVFSAVLLWLFHKRERFIQMYTAILGTSFITNCFSAAIVLTFHALVWGAPQTVPFVFPLFAIMSIIPLIWAVAIQASIFRYALDTSLMVGVLIAVLLLIFGFLTFGVLNL